MTALVVTAADGALEAGSSDLQNEICFLKKMIITHLRNMSHVLVKSHKCPGFNVYNIQLGFSCSFVKFGLK